MRFLASSVLCSRTFDLPFFYQYNGSIWLDEKSGKPTRYNIYRHDIEEAIYHSNSVDLFYKHLICKGYDVDLNGLHWKLKLHKYEHYTRFDTLDKEYTPDYIQERIRDSYNRY